VSVGVARRAPRRLLSGALSAMAHTAAPAAPAAGCRPGGCGGRGERDQQRRTRVDADLDRAPPGGWS